MENGRHHVRIGRLATRLEAGPGSAGAWAATMDAAARGPLARALGEEVEHRFAGREAIIRVRHLHLAWRLSSGADLSAGELAGALARRIAAALADALARATPDEVRLWPNQATFVATWLRHRLGIETAPDWAFPDFAALNSLTGAEAAVEMLIATGAGLLPYLARTEAEAEALALALPGAAIERLLLAFIGAARPTAATLAGAAQQLSAPALPAGEAGRAVFVALLRPAGAAPPTAGIDGGALAALLLAASAIARLRAAGLAARSLAAVAKGEATPPATTLSPAESLALRRTVADPALWAGLLAATATKGAKAPAAATTDAAPAQLGLHSGGLHSGLHQGLHRGLHIPTDYAGLAPLLPLCPCPEAPPETIRAVALLLLPEAKAPLAARDAGFGFLFPADPRRAPHPLPAPPESAWEGQGTLAGAPRRPGLGGHADLWLARFAARLPGLQASSRSYLAQQFLLQPGRITPDDDLIHVHLPGFALAIVLRMSGLVDLSAPIPHLGGQRLSITLEV